MQTVHTFRHSSGRTFEWPDVHRGTALFVQNLAEAQRVESGPLATVEVLQRGMVMDLLAHARAHSPFWADRMQGVDSWDQLPILDRAGLEAQVTAEGALATGLAREKVKQCFTSGSTGHAVPFYRTRRASYMNRLRYTLDHLEQGRDLSRKMALTKFNAEPGEREKWPWPTAMAKYLPTGPAIVANHAQIPPQALARWLREAEPAYLFTTAPVLDLLTEVWEAEPALAPRLEQVGTYSFNLTAATREAVRRHTGARIADRYSSEEAGPIAFQCPQSDTRYHVATSNVVLEIVGHDGRPAEPGQLGRVLVTALHNYATPILRYELGDLAAMRNGCECGHQGPVISHLAGRARAFLYVGPGGYRDFTITARQWKAVAPLREYRVQQVALRRLEAEVVADVRLDDEAFGRLKALIAANCPADFEIAVAQVPAIDWGPGYKRLEFRCLVP